MTTRTHGWLAMLALVAAACGDDDGGEQPNAPDAALPAVTFWQDVAPIYFENCVGCHQEGSIAPFALDTYESARTFAEAAKAETQARTMPPWLVTDDGTCGEYHYSRALSQEQIDTIAAWVDGGAVEGEPRSNLQTPAIPALDSGMDVQTPSFVPEIQGGQLAEFDEYRCFLIDVPGDADTFLTGYDVLPGNPAMVHHVLGILVDPDFEVAPGITNRDVITQLDNESPDRDGWPCFGAAGDGTEERDVPITWAPGQGITEYPEGTGVRIRSTDLFVVQVHYNMAEEEVRGQSDQTTVRLRLEDSVAREGFFILPDLFIETIESSEPASLEPRQASVEYTWELDVGQALAEFGLPNTVEVHGVFPHMHEYGRKLRVELIQGDESQCAADVQNWDFHWQLFYFYKTPFTITPETRMRVTCTYNTLDADEPVTPGWGTRNEMCLAGLFLVP